MVLARDVEEQVGGLLVVAVVLDDECLEHLGHTRKKIPLRKALQKLRAHVCKRWLADDSEDVLVLVEVHARLASDRRIDLRKQSRRHIRKTHSPLVDARRKTHHVRRDASSDSQNHRIPVGSVLQQPCTYVHHRLKGLALLGGLYKLDLCVSVLEDFRQLAGRRTLSRDVSVNDRIDAPVRFQARGQVPQGLRRHDAAYRLLSGIYVYLLHRGWVLVRAACGTTAVTSYKYSIFLHISARAA